MLQQKIDTGLTNDIEFSDQQKMYDETCKRILSNKMILGWLMKECIWEYQDKEVKEIANIYIEGTPVVGDVKVFGGEKIRGLPTEAIGGNNGKIFYDIRYRAVVPKDDDLIELIVNVEAQNQYHVGYPLVKRGGFYSCQMIANQYGTEFETINYNEIKKVYSIWICRDVPKVLENAITCYEMSERNIVGNVKEVKSNYDLISVVMVYLGQANNQKQSNLLSLLNQLLSEELKAEDKLAILERDYQIPRTKKLEGEIQYMCNLSNGLVEKGIYKGVAQGIKQGIEQGIKQGIEQGIEQGKVEIAKSMLSDHISLDVISKHTGLSVAQLEELNR